jgi:hypothetical protein
MTHTDPSVPPPPSGPASTTSTSTSTSPGAAGVGPPARALVARSPADLLAAVPVVLGFRAAESVVMLTFPRATRREGTVSGGRPEAFHARVDLPEDPAALPDLADALLGPVLRHAIDRVALVVYTADPALAGRCGDVLARAFGAAGVELVELLHADGSRWFGLLPGRPAGESSGTPYDDRSHPFLAQAVLDGRVTLGSRAELAAGLVAPDPAVPAAVGRAVDELDRAGPEAGDEEGAWLEGALDRRLAGASWSDGDVARVVADLRDVDLRDRAWARMRREVATTHVELWRDVVRRCPTRLLPGPACLLAFAAWLAGHGALAWCALDRCREADPDYRLAGLVASLLDQAVPPSAWQPPDPVPRPRSQPARSQTGRGTRH